MSLPTANLMCLCFGVTNDKNCAQLILWGLKFEPPYTTFNSFLVLVPKKFIMRHRSVLPKYKPNAISPCTHQLRATASPSRMRSLVIQAGSA